LKTKMNSILFCILFCLSTFVQAQQQERIIRFHSDIKIETDGRIEVAEHIKVYAAGDEIKRGIIREFPLTRDDKRGKKARMNYNILAVRRNGEDTRYEIEKENGNMLIYIRDMNVLLDPGEYDFNVVYESYEQIGFFDDYDDFYWNVTGNTSIFPIEQASAAITLPLNASVIQTDFYTGVKGSKGKDCTVEDRGNMQVFTSTRRLEPKEGLTVAVGFTRDVITRPPPPAFWEEYIESIYGCMCALICLLFFFLTLGTAGKRPPKPVAIPTFTPPRNLSPASMYYFTHKKCRGKAFTATLVDMAVKGAMSIRCEKKKYSLLNKMNTEGLRPEEQKIHATLFPVTKTKESEIIGQLNAVAESNPEPEVNLNGSNYLKVSNAYDVLEDAMKKQWNLKDYFRANRIYVGIGGLVLNAVFVLYVILTGWTGDVAYALLIAIPFIVLEIAFLFSAFKELTFGRTHWQLTALPSLFILMSTWARSGDTVHWPSFAFFAALSVIYIVYTRRIRGVFTPKGAALDSELEGFKMYLKTAEEHRLNILTPPERTPELFEKLLPYALALGVSNEWCGKFDNVLKQFDYRPQWYDSSEKLSTTGFATSFKSLDTSFNSSVGKSGGDFKPVSSSSSGSSSWSSGSGGGGYSGGGGGGGGVRGC